MARKLTKKQKGFIKDYLETGNATEAAERNYNVANRNVANAIGAENLAKPSVREYIESKAQRASEIIVELAETAENETVRLNASKDILDRAGLKPVEKNITLHGDIEELQEHEKGFVDRLLNAQRAA